MSFIEPWFLLGGLAALIPVVIHLLKLNKPETVAFSTLAFFKELTDTTVKRLNIKRWLLLLFRILAILALTLALAQPTNKNAPNAAITGSQNSLNLLIDNSLSTGISDNKGVRLYRLTEQAKAWVRQLNQEAKVYLTVTHGEWEYNSALSPTEAIDVLSQIQPSKGADFFNQRLKELTQKAMAVSGVSSEVHILHDGQFKSFENLMGVLKNEISQPELENLKIGYLPLNGAIQNTWIKYVGTTNSWISANKKMTIKVQMGKANASGIKNEADSQNTINKNAQKLAVFANNRMISEQAIPENVSSLEASFTPTSAGNFAIKAVISGDSYVLDNTFYSVLKVPEKLKILWVSDNYKEQNQAKSSFYNALNAAINSGYALQIDAVAADAIPVKSLNQYQVVIMEGITTWPAYADLAIRDFVQQDGGGLWLIPSPNTNLSNWNKKSSALGLPTFEGLIGNYATFTKQTSLERIRATHPIFQGMFNDAKMEEEGWSPTIDSPSIYYYYKMGALSGSYPILQTEERNPILVEKKLGKGLIWSMAMGFDPAWSNISIKAIFAPLVFNGIHFLNAANENTFFADKSLVAPLVFELKQALAKNTAVLNDSVNIALTKNAALNGFSYSTLAPNVQAGIIQLDSTTFGLNPPNWESEPDYFNLAQFKSQVSATKNPNQTADKNALWDTDFITTQVFELTDIEQNMPSVSLAKSLPLWTWFALLALIFLLIESLISRYFRVQGTLPKTQSSL